MQDINRKQIVSFTLIILISTVLWGCAQSKLTSSWTDQSFTGPVTDTILVIGAFKNPATHNIFEDSFVESLKAAGAKAVPSYTYGIEEERHSKQWLEQVRKKSGARYILISHLDKVSIENEDYPAEGVFLGGEMVMNDYYGVDGYYSVVVEDIVVPEETLTKTTDYIVATLFDSMTGKPVWSAHSKNVDLNHYLKKDDKKLERLLIQDMKRHNIL